MGVDVITGDAVGDSSFESELVVVAATPATDTPVDDPSDPALPTILSSNSDHALMRRDIPAGLPLLLATPGNANPFMTSFVQLYVVQIYVLLMQLVEGTAM
ncbi:hypothetical protein CVT24_005541 [Panaeolus cyanescens]|uniref:Uncharacterized protein n=1 Tax=Panaeolus cyanescens TaxID=181874 RepID=A0A409VQK9_9AGAR|nr:hypothetical protein CVT24_005541 [Panaeolus cyanescens]